MTPIIVYKDGLIFTADDHPEEGDVEMYQRIGFFVMPCNLKRAKDIIRILDGNEDIRHADSRCFSPAKLIHKDIKYSAMNKYLAFSYTISNKKKR